MKKTMKHLAMLSTTALLVLGASFSAMAATQGWVSTNGRYQYLDSNGYAVTDEWKKSGDYWYYLDDDGNMATNKLIDDGSNYYVVDANGVMVTNQWAEMEDEDGETNWYYLQSSGKAKQDGFLTVDGKRYHFTDGKMDER